MATLDITVQNFADTIDNNAILILDFWASWCGPCKQFAPGSEAAATVHTDIVFDKIDTDAQSEPGRRILIVKWKRIYSSHTSRITT